MEVLNNKIDFTVIFAVSKANPNGDPLDGNRPRINYDDYGEVSIPNNRIQELILYLADLEDWLERKGLL